MRLTGLDGVIESEGEPQLGASSISGATRTSVSSLPRTWATALLHRYRLGALTGPPRNELSSTYRAAVFFRQLNTT
jgi:hypothetical protein